MQGGENEKKIAVFAIIVACLFAVVNFNSTNVYADFEDVTYEDYDSSNPNG